MNSTANHGSRNTMITPAQTSRVTIFTAAGRISAIPSAHIFTSENMRLSSSPLWYFVTELSSAESSFPNRLARMSISMPARTYSERLLHTSRRTSCNSTNPPSPAA